MPDAMKKFFANVAPFLPILGYLTVGVAILVGGYYGVKTLFEKFGAGTSSDPTVPGAQKNASVLDGIINATVQVGHSSQSYTGAAQEVLTDPIGSFKSILGWN